MNALFLKLLNMSAAGSVLILAVVVLRALLSRAPRWIICVMWALVAVRLVCPLSIASPLSAFRATPSIVSERGEVELFRPAGGSEKPLLAVDTVQIERPQSSSETLMEIPGTALAVTQRSRDAYLPPLVQAYLLGVAAMLLYALISTLLLRKKTAASLRQPGNIRVCDELPAPFILGVIRPSIYLPSALRGEEKDFVLAHERAHLRRLDHVWKPLGFLILSLHWFNPLCWLAWILLCRDIELACDEKVVRALGNSERAAYSQALLNCSTRRSLSACPVAFGETGTKKRVKAVLNYKRPAFWIVLAAVLACVVLVVCFAAKPVPETQDLSFLNYKNAIPLIGMNETAPEAVRVSGETGSMQPGVADGKALARFLENAKWTKRRTPSPAPEPRGYLEFGIEEDYRIIVYQSQRLAAVRFASEIRYYRTVAGDYEAALAAFLPAPSTEPDPPPERTAAPGSAALRRMTPDDVAALAEKGKDLTWADLMAYEGQEIGSGRLIWRFPIDDDSCLEAYDGDLRDKPERVLLLTADENGAFRAGPGLSVDLFSQDVSDFLSRARSRAVTVSSGGAAVEARLYLLYEKTWTEHDWLFADGPPLALALEEPERIPTLTLADDFAVRFEGYVRKSGLQIYDEQFRLLRDAWYGDTAANWLAPGSYYGVIEAFGPPGRYIASEDAYEEGAYRCVFRLRVPAAGVAPYVPEKASGLTEARLHIFDRDYVLTDAADLAKLERWLKNAAPLPAGAGCPFGSVLTLTCGDGRAISCCPAEDSCGVVFANGVYYRYASDNEGFWEMFGIQLR